jgi:glycosyltransferase involved in cell wall biosynthesis
MSEYGRNKMGIQGPSRSRPRNGALYTTSSFAAADMPQRCGDDCYSYYFVYRAFAPLLARWGEVHEISRPDAELEPALDAALARGREPAHLSFLPLQYLRLAPRVPNIAFPFWEYPDIPNCDVAGNPRNNWPRVAEKLALILTACDFTRQALLRGGVRVPIRVVQVPIGEPYFGVADWSPGERVVLDCPCYLLPQKGGSSVSAPAGASRADRARWTYQHRVRPRLPRTVDRLVSRAGRKLLGRSERPTDPYPIPYQASDRLELAGVVYTSIFNPFDMRKNWQDLLAACLAALGDQDDATLVLKLAVSKTMAREGLHNVLSFYQRLGRRHRCKLAVVSAYLSDEQMVELARASTYYLNASRAEGACLPVQDFLAAGRPAVAPSHTAMAEYIDESLAFVAPSASEPTHWSWDPERRPTTRWHVVDRPALERRIRESYETARGDRARYRAMAQAARARMRDFASAESVWPRLAEALKLIWPEEEGARLVA